MKSKSIFLLGTVSAILPAAGAAHAEGSLNTNTVAIPASYTDTNYSGRWDGFYIGLHGGSSNFYGDFNGYSPSGVDWPYSWDDNKLKASGLSGGVQLGINVEMQNGFVVGFEGDFSKLSASEKDSYNTGYEFTDGWNQSVSVDNLATARLRAGMAIGDSALIYATGGLAYAEIETGIDGDGALNSDYAFASKKDWKAGYVIGGGLEFALTDNISMKGEVLHYDLGKFGKHESLYDNGDTYAWGAKTSVSGNSVSVGLNFAF